VFWGFGLSLIAVTKTDRHIRFFPIGIKIPSDNFLSGLQYPTIWPSGGIISYLKIDPTKDVNAKKWLNSHKILLTCGINHLK
jgi:hypothetical protein